MDFSNPLWLVLHGSITLVVTLSCGFLYGKYIDTTESEKERAWKLVHVAGSLGGMVLLLVAGIEDQLLVSATFIAGLNGSLLVSNYAFLVAMILAAVSGNRGLGPGGPAANRAVRLLYTVAVATALLTGVLLVAGSARSLGA